MHDLYNPWYTLKKTVSMTFLKALIFRVLFRILCMLSSKWANSIFFYNILIVNVWYRTSEHTINKKPCTNEILYHAYVGYREEDDACSMWNNQYKLVTLYAWRRLDLYVILVKPVCLLLATIYICIYLLKWLDTQMFCKKIPNKINTREIIT
jgi:hypothetical protein